MNSTGRSAITDQIIVLGFALCNYSNNLHSYNYFCNRILTSDISVYSLYTYYIFVEHISLEKAEEQRSLRPGRF